MDPARKKTQGKAPKRGKTKRITRTEELLRRQRAYDLLLEVHTLLMNYMYRFKNLARNAYLAREENAYGKQMGISSGASRPNSCCFLALLHLAHCPKYGTVRL